VEQSCCDDRKDRSVQKSIRTGTLTAKMRKLARANDNINELLPIFISGRTKRLFEWKRGFVSMGQKKKKKSKKKQ
jgi:hypothetical protein